MDTLPRKVIDGPAPLEWSFKDLVWYRIVLLVFLHVHLPYSIYLYIYHTSLALHVWTLFVTVYGGMGVTIGAHRLWAHRSFKATRNFQILAMLCFSSNFQDDILTWVNTHRTHHKYSDTDKDPHDSRRGFIYSHFGWLVVKEKKLVTEARRSVDMSDLLANPVVMFNRKYCFPLALVLTLLVPVGVPVLWGESLLVSYMVLFVFRYTFILHGTFIVNSLAHMYGNRPYDSASNARQNAFVTFITTGEGWHNYHHVFPYDYRASEFPWLYNLSAIFIDLFAFFGMVHDRRSVPQYLIDRRKERNKAGY